MVITMFLKKRHLEILKMMKETDNIKKIEKSLPEDFSNRIIELRILDLVDVKEDSIKFTEGGKKLVEVLDNLNVDELPDIFINSEIIKILQLLEETGIINDDWATLLKERQLIDEEGNINTVGKTILEIYNTTHPTIYLTKDILSFISGMPKLGLYSELVSYRDSKGMGQNIVNALEGMRLLLISPNTENGKAFTTTEALNDALKISSLVPNAEVLILKKEDFEALKGGNTTDYSNEVGYYKDGKITDLGQSMVDMYENIGKTATVKILPIYVLEDEIDVLNAISDIEEKYKTNPEIIPTYNEINKRVNMDNLGEVIHILQSKELIKPEVIKNKDTYWLTSYGRKVMGFGPVSTDGTKAVVYPKSGDVPISDWVIVGKEEGTVKGGITEKGKFLMELSKSIKRKPYLTKYDISILLKTPVKRYIHKDELIKLIMDHVGGDEKEIIKAIGESESKGFIVELQNKCIKLTELGNNIKESIEMAKIPELLNTKFAITPTTFTILETIYNNKKDFDRVWKEKTEGKGKDHKENEIILLGKLLKLTIDEIKKSLIILRNTGFIGKKGLTDASIKLVESYKSLNN